MQLLVQQIVEGLAAGAIYASLALALVLVHRATRIVNFAQGEMGLLSAYLAWQLIAWGVPLVLALLISAVFSFVLGVVVFKCCIRPVLAASAETIVVICTGLFLGFEALCLLLWGPDTRAFPEILPRFVWMIDGVRLTSNNVGMLIVLSVLASGLAAWFKLTRVGLAMRAAAAERDNSLLVGIDVPAMLAMGWGIAAVFGFVAAVLVAPHLLLTPTMMLSVIIYALAAATLGGWDSPTGAIIGGLVVGVAESLGASFIPFIGSELKLVVPFALITIALLVRPQGIFGVSTRVRV
jgi:branched-chain amino acid transport system permease protein